MRRIATALAYHGCDQAVGEAVVAGREEIRGSANDYDWLGSGAYFWEDSYRRAWQWAHFMAGTRSPARTRVRTPFVIGAIIDPGNCLDLSNAKDLAILAAVYPAFVELMALSGKSLPANEPAHRSDEDLVKRFLDCAVINFLHAVWSEQGETPFDTVRCPFPEGGSLFAGSGIQARTHVQWCVRDPQKSIIGYFLPRFHASRDEDNAVS